MLPLIKSINSGDTVLYPHLTVIGLLLIMMIATSSTGIMLSLYGTHFAVSLCVALVVHGHAVVVYMIKLWVLDVHLYENLIRLLMKIHLLLLDV